MESSATYVDVILFDMNNNIINYKSGDASTSYQGLIFGDFSFDNLPNGKYYIILDSSRRAAGYGEVYSVNDEGKQFELKVYIDVFNIDNLLPWEWTQEYNLEGGGTGTICPEAYIPMDEMGFHPITAVEWNNFTNKIEEVRACLGGQPFGFTEVFGASNGYANNPSLFTVRIYNEAAEAIKVLGGDIEPIENGQELNAQIFIDLQEQLNAVIDSLD
jgi:hypothetical protein